MSHESISETRMNGHHGEGKVPALKALTGEKKTTNMQTNSQLLIRPKKNYIKKYESDRVGIRRRLLRGSIHLVDSCVTEWSCDDHMTIQYRFAITLLKAPIISLQDFCYVSLQVSFPSAFSIQLQEGVF